MMEVGRLTVVEVHILGLIFQAMEYIQYFQMDRREDTLGEVDGPQAFSLYFNET